MATSTPRLSEFARLFHYPPGIKRTVWPRVEAKGLELGLGFDWWQSQLGTVCLGYGDDGKYVATVGGIGMSIPRQVGKTYFVLAVLVILCILFPGLQVIWTAHHLRTSTKTFTALRGICRRQKVAPHVKAMRAANGEQQVAFHNGSMIMFGARSMGFGRGFDEIDVEVFDEAQILDTKALEDMIAATNQARHEHGALLFFMGTPPRPTDPSEAFTARRAEAWAGEAEDAIWLEIGAEPGSSPNDRAQWPIMNPSFPSRTPLESMLRLRKNLKNDDSWNREGRGIWDAEDNGTAIPIGAWQGQTDAASEIVGPVVFSVETAQDRKTSVIAAGGRRADGWTHVELVRHGTGTSWVLDELMRLTQAHGGSVVIDGISPAASLVPALKDAGLDPTVTNAPDMARACGSIHDAVVDGQLFHLGDDLVESALLSAGTRPLSGGWAWDRKSGDISPIVAVTLAAYGVLLLPEPEADPQVHDWPTDDEMSEWEDDE
jgi:hypothetical protein